jgi:predicted nucleic-acid-binding protein
MIALDTNVLVRFLVEDDKQQSARAARIIQGATERDEALFVSDIVLCELVWVLSTSYQTARAEIAATLERLVQAKQLAFTDAERVRRAADAYATGRGDFAGYLIREHARDAGCTAVVTFDRALLKDKLFAAP